MMQVAASMVLFALDTELDEVAAKSPSPNMPSSEEEVFAALLELFSMIEFKLFLTLLKLSLLKKTTLHLNPVK